jgi:hypothetical protein
MARVREAAWAALAPWTGIQGKPPFLNGPDGNIQISDVEGLTEALAIRPRRSDFARVAFTGRYSDLLGLPHFGSAAFVDVSYFQVAYTAKTLQVGSVPFVAGTQKYAVVFTTTMNAVPKVKTQCFMADDNGENFFATIPDDSLSVAGFSFWLNGVPTGSTGRLAYRAVVESQP